MPLRTYTEVRPWARAIRNAVMRGEMPPFHAAGAVGRFEDDPRLTGREIAQIVAWVDTGSAPGPGAKEEAAPEAGPASVGWKGGEPDLVLATAPHTLELTKAKHEQYAAHYIDYQFPEDTWVEAVEFRHSDTSLVHHATLNLVNREIETAEEKVRAQLESGHPNIAGVADSLEFLGSFVSSWLPGRTIVRAKGKVLMIPRGSRLMMNSHYYWPTGGDRADTVTVETQIGFHFYSGELTELRGESVPPPPSILIEPGDAHYEQTFEEVLAKDVWIESYDLHMHMRGASSEVTLIFPDGRESKVFEIPRYAFHWQRDYWLAEPVFAPKGTRILHRSVWNNSASNPNRPDPTMRIRNGMLSNEEMWVSSVGYRFDEPRPVPLRIVNGLQVSPPDGAGGNGTPGTGDREDGILASDPGEAPGLAAAPDSP